MVVSDCSMNRLTEFRRGWLPALWYFFYKYHSLLHQDIMDQCGDKELAKLILKVPFAAAWQRRRVFRSEDQLKKFLFCAARIELNRKRKEAQDGHINISDDFAGNEREIEEEKTAFARRPMIALNDLPGQQKKFIAKRHIERKTVKDIAAAANLAERTVTNHLHRGMKTLREQVKGSNKN